MKKDKFSKYSLALLWVFAFIIIIFIMSFSVNAEESYFPMNQNDNSKFSETLISNIESRFDSENNYIFIRFVNYNPNSGYGRYNFNYLYFPKNQDGSFYGELNSNGYQFSLYSIGNPTFSQGSFWTDRRYPDTIEGVSGNMNYASWFQNLDSSLYNSNASYISNFRLWTDNSNTKTTVLRYGADPPPPLDLGVAIIPPDAFVPEYPTGTTPPSQVPPTFTSSDYNWTTPPIFDSSSIENAIGSIQNTLGWIANNLKEEFKNLTNNLKGFFKYIGDTIQYYGNSLLLTLNNFIQNFYDNMKALVEPIFQKIDYITTPLEADIIWDNISGTSLITNYSSIINAASSLKSSFENLAEPTEYKIPIHLENISTFGTLTTQYIDLSVINPVKPIIRTFMWALITYSLVVTIIDSIANYINGGGDES